MRRLSLENLEAKQMLTGMPGPSENWGALTSYAIHELDFDQGQHASDPSGDGHGQGTVDEPRAGLANVVEQGNMAATVDLIFNSLP